MLQYQQLGQLYVAADLLLDAELKNRVMNELCSKNEQGTYRTWNQSIPYVWAHTPSGCGLRRFMCDRYLSKDPEGLRKFFEKHEEGFPKEFFYDFTMRQLEFRDGKQAIRDTCSATRCLYHEHDGEDDRTSCEMDGKKGDGRK